MSGKYALIIANTEYKDSGLAQLTAPGKDAKNFARVLQDQGICAFDDVNILLNQPEPVVREAIDDFYNQKKTDDLLVLYFSGHGIRDEYGTLYLAVKNTNRSKLRSTAVKSDYIRETMDQSRSNRQVLILDCCNSGAYSQGTKAATGVSIGTASAFEGGYGRIILTASDSTQFAWEGDRFIGETENSLFTHYLVKGLEGEADLDGDGRITVDELYDYTYDKVRLTTSTQTPSKFSTRQQGEIVLRQTTGIINLLQLPVDLIAATENSSPYVREGAVKQLEAFLQSKNVGLALLAKNVLEKIAQDDDSRRIALLARYALSSTTHNTGGQTDENGLNTGSTIQKKNTIPIAGKKKNNGKSFLMALGGFGIPIAVTLLVIATIIIANWPSPTLPAPTKIKTTTPQLFPAPTKVPILNNETPTFTKSPTILPVVRTATSQSCPLTYCDDNTEDFCVYSISPQPSSVIVALKYKKEISPLNLPKLTVGSQKFDCALLAAYPGRLYCEGASIVGDTKLELVSSTNTTICSGTFTIRKYVAVSPTPIHPTDEGSHQTIPTISK